MSAGGAAGGGRRRAASTSPTAKDRSPGTTTPRRSPSGFSRTAPEFFARLSKYDDFLADVAGKPGYNAGDTLRLLPPFLKAFAVGDDDVRRFSAAHVLLVPKALEALAAIRAVMPVFIISTSYTPYLRALCDLADFPFDHVRCTELSLDAWEMPEAEAGGCASGSRGSARGPSSSIRTRPSRPAAGTAAAAQRGQGGGAGAAAGRPGGPAWRSPDEALAWLTEDDRATVRELDRLFWEEMPLHPVSQALSDSVQPVGGGRKLAALEEIVAAEGVDGAGVMYVGDSITDTPPLAAVRAWGGVSLSFNGNAYAIQAAEFAAASPDAEVQAVLARSFAGGGREAVVAAVRGWPEPEGTRRRAPVRRPSSASWPRRPRHSREASAAMRRSVRGERIAGLG